MISAVTTTELSWAEQAVGQEQLVRDVRTEGYSLILSWIGEMSATTPLRTSSKHLGCSAGTSTPRAVTPVEIPAGVGAAEQKRPKAREAKAERAKERIMSGQRVWVKRVTWSGRRRRESRWQTNAEEKSRVDERFYSHSSLGDNGPSPFMKLGWSDALSWMTREAPEMKPEEDGVGVLANQDGTKATLP